MNVGSSPTPSISWEKVQGKVNYAVSKVGRAFDKMGPTLFQGAAWVGMISGFSEEVMSHSKVTKIEVGRDVAKVFGEVKKVEVLSLLHIFHIPCSIKSLVGQWQDAVKPWEHGEAFLASLTVLEDIVRTPGHIVEVANFFKEGVDVAAHATQWAPWLSAVALLLSTAKVGVEGRSLWKSAQFDKRMQRKCYEAIVKHLDRSIAAKSDVVQKLIAEATGAVDDADTMLLLKKFRQELLREKPDLSNLKKIYAEVFGKGRAGQKLGEALKEVVDSNDLKAILGDPKTKKKLLIDLEKQLSLLRKSRDNVALVKLVEGLAEELRKAGGAVPADLKEVAAAAYVESLKESKGKALERQFKVGPDSLKAEIDRVSKLYNERKSKGDPQAGAYIEGVVESLKGRAEQCKGSSIYSITSSVVSVVAASIFVAIAFGVSSSPLAPIGLAIVVVLLTVGITAYFYERSKRKAFERTIGIAEQKKCDNWIKKIDKVRRREHKLNAAVAPELLELRRSLVNRDFTKQWKFLDLEALKKQEALAKQGADKAKIAELKGQRTAAERYNKIVREVNRWQKQKGDRPDRFAA